MGRATNDVDVGLSGLAALERLLERVVDRLTGSENRGVQVQVGVDLREGIAKQRQL